MAKHTRKLKSHGLPKLSSTFCGVHEWYEREVEKFGWMILAKERGYDYKITGYKKALEHLSKMITHLMGEYQDPDKKHDLAVLLMHTECVKAAANRML